MRDGRGVVTMEAQIIREGNDETVEVTLAGTGVDGDKIYLYFEDPEDTSASVQMGWLIELIRYHNRPFADNLDPQDVNRLHICDLDDFIERLPAAPRCTLPTSAKIGERGLTPPAMV